MDNRFRSPTPREPALANRFDGSGCASTQLRRRQAFHTAFDLSTWSQPMSAGKRTLLILIENGGVDLGIPALVDRLVNAVPGADSLPEGYKKKLVDFLHEKITGFTDTLIENAELTLNRYQAAKPDYFGSVVVLRNGTASYDELKKQLFSLSRDERMVDVLILTHGGEDSISVTGGISGQRIRDMRAAFGRALSIRSVYMMNCVGSSLNQAWLDAGAKVSSGAVRNNYLPEPTTYFFWQAWKAGKAFDSAVTSAYQRTIELMNTAVREFISALPFPLDQLAGLVNFADMDFVKDSAPVIQGDTSVSIASDDLVFSQSLMRGPALAMTVLPLAVLRSIAQAQSAPTQARRACVVSAQGLAFIKRQTPFHATPYAELGYCAIGYGTALHRGPCDGRAEERRYADGIPEEAAMQLLAERVRHCEDVLNDTVHPSLGQNQTDALASFVFSLGHKRFRESTLLQLLNAGDLAAVPLELRKWTKVQRDGVLIDLPELVARRQAEAELFTQADTGTAQSLANINGLLRRRYAQAYSSDIPLDPGSGGRSIDVAALQTGDLIVTTRNGPVSAAIRAATQAPVSHAILYIGNGQVVEAIGAGVTLRSLEQALAGTTVAVAFRDPELTPEQALKVRDYAGRQLDKPFNYMGLVRQGGFQLDRAVFCSGKSGADYEQCVNWVGNINLGRGSDDSFFCSQLVVAAFESAGNPLTSTPPNWTSPSDLAELGMARKLGYVGHLKAPPVDRPAAVTSQSLSLLAPAPGRTVVTQALATPMGFAATEWEPLISFRPPVAIQSAVNARGVHWHVHRIEDANGDINLDYYPITVSALPVVAGRTIGADELLASIRLNLNSFVDTRIAEFSPYDDGEAAVWKSSSPLGSVVHIDMKAFGGWLNPDDGSVVVAEAAADHWTFSTIWTVMDMAHPVSGNRQFGYTAAEGGGYVFYTRGADRTTGLLDLAAMSVVYSSAHNLWLSFQSGVEAYVNRNGGAAVVGSATSIRTPWPAIRASSHHPSVAWV